jgi:DNA-binding GntR family transcriptional regulator
VRSTPWRAYAQITSVLRDRFTDVAAGSAVPSEAALVAEFGVARNTIRRALAALEQDGVVVALPGRGRVVGKAEQTAAGFRRVADELRASIESGRLAPGDRVPSEQALAVQFGVSRGTARRGLAELEAAGLVTAVQGRGRFVDGPGRG